MSFIVEVIILLSWLTALFVPTLPEGLKSLIAAAVLTLALRALRVRMTTTKSDRAAAMIFAVLVVASGAGLVDHRDMTCAAALVIAIIAALDRRHAVMLGWFGLAVGVAPQTIFVAPFFLAMLINRGVPLRLWPIAPLVALATTLVAWVAGSAIPLSVELDPSLVGELSFGAPNIWAMVPAMPYGLPLIGLAVAAAIGATVAYIAYFSAIRLNDRQLLNAALLAPLVLVGLLPWMRADDFFIAAVLALTLYDRANWRVAVLIQGSFALAMFGHFGGLPALAMIIATLHLARPLLKPAANDNPMLARTIERSTAQSSLRYDRLTPIRSL